MSRSPARFWALAPGLTTAILALVLNAGTAAGQSSPAFALELRAGPAVGNVSQSGAGLEIEPGPALAVTGEVPVGPVRVYAGFSRAVFGCAAGFCTDQDVTYTSQGLLAGVRWSRGLPWVRAGFAYQALDIEANGTDDAWDAGPGWDLAAGIELPVGPLRLRPGVSYLRYWVPDNGTAAVFALEVGAALEFGG